MRDLITSLLESERLAAGHSALQPKPVDLAALVHEVADAAGARRRDAATDLTRGARAGRPDPAALLLRNLLDNARRHGADAAQPPQVFLRREADGRWRWVCATSAPACPTTSWRVWRRPSTAPTAPARAPPAASAWACTCAAWWRRRMAANCASAGSLMVGAKHSRKSTSAVAPKAAAVPSATRLHVALHGVHHLARERAHRAAQFGRLRDHVVGIAGQDAGDDSTAESSGATLRATMDCRLTATCAATSAASTLVSGRAPCEPRPVMRMSKNAPPAIIGPLFTLKRPTASLGRLCMPNTAVAREAREQAVVDHGLGAAQALLRRAGR
jgi:hypothetical protein